MVRIPCETPRYDRRKAHLQRKLLETSRRLKGGGLTDEGARNLQWILLDVTNALKELRL